MQSVTSKLDASSIKNIFCTKRLLKQERPRTRFHQAPSKVCMCCHAAQSTFIRSAAAAARSSDIRDAKKPG